MIEKDTDLDSIFGTLNNLKILGDINAFKDWLTAEYGITECEFEKNLFEGYKYSIETLIRIFIDKILLEYSLDIETDFLFDRACSEGINIEKIPTTCEKRKVVQKINSELEKIEKAENIRDFEKRFKNFKKVVMEPFEIIYDEYIETTNKNSTKADALTRTSIHIAYLDLTNCERMEPFGYYVVILNRNNYKNNSLFLLDGYKFSLQYLWKVLLGDDYKNTCIEEIHNATLWAKQYDEDLNLIEKPGITINNFSNKISDIIFNQKNDIFDSFFKMKKKDQKYYSILKRVQSNSFSDPKFKMNEKIDQMLLWYKVDLLGSSRSDVFNGIKTFCQLLIGSVEFRKRNKNSDKTIIRKFIHPNEKTEGNDYTYGILIESRSILADYSGWLLFFDSCTDYSGLGGSEHMFAETIIDELINRDLVELKELVVPKYELFNIIFKKRTPTHENRKEFEDHYEEISYNYENLLKRNKLLETKLDDARGFLTELLTYYSISTNYSHLKLDFSDFENEYNSYFIGTNEKHKEDTFLFLKDYLQKRATSIDWRKKIDNREFDVFLKNKEEKSVVECKAKLENTDVIAEIEKIFIKNAIMKDDDIDIQTVFSFYEKPKRKEIIKILEKNNIEYLIIKDELKKLGKSPKDLDNALRKN
ncbi:hypothetical protein MmiHf6_01630 [Methanimicrococcus hongohii]|uniref:Uncharacterized protein n=1 Tax=Methanimicrococcus hongohii TaxID=3028295 RepID=A0AA96V051_9EURY|nr:hypothetical protein [Methanimicrococcus sp. Hf6]WNY22875.1 hypothetical protein MmiHf6_01630 [Methanimicrococcus sp. Hf6]